MKKYDCCEHCEGAGDVCIHPMRLGDDCPDGLDDCDSCDSLKQCSECGGDGCVESGSNKPVVETTG
jgi:hypothetical protein